MSQTHIIIVADTGSLRAFELEHPPERSPFPREIEAIDLIATNKQLHEKVTDQAGAMPSGGAPGAMSHAGNEGIQLEDKARAIRDLGGHIERILTEHKAERWSFAAPSSVNQAILDAIPDRRWKESVRESLGANLVNVREQDFGKHFKF